ncbi:MAG: MFS transporter, partial [Pseudomonadota bacterium]
FQWSASAMPALSRNRKGIALADHWKMYIAVVVLSLPGTVGLILFVERHPAGYLGTPVSVALLAVSFAGLALAGPSAAVVGGVLVLFFAAFNFLEARLPALISRFAPDERRGAALGVYASAQFTGAFAGGAVGGALLGVAGPEGVFVACASGGTVWAALMAQIYLTKPEFRT